MNRRFGYFLFFFVFFGIYLYSAGNHVVAYRDSGEMTTLHSTLGVAHPPGYPLYTLIGKAAQILLPGNPAYRSNVLSALFSAGAVLLFFLFLRRFFSFWPSLTGSCFLGFSALFWELSSVSEMYSMGVFFLVLALVCYWRWNNSILMFYVLGLGLGVRLDMLLLVFVITAWLLMQRIKMNWLHGILFFGVGCSTFLYLPIRSFQNPWLDWANPETLGALFRSVSRASYGRTLDLLSLNYTKGENFFSTLNHFAQQWNGMLVLLGLVVVGLGVYGSYKQNKWLANFVLGLFLISGPIFFFLANMPPNPHSLAVVEAVYPVPNLFLFFFLAAGLEWCCGKWSKGIFASLLFLLMCGWSIPLSASRGIKRNDFQLRDYTTAVLRSAPRSSTLIFHEDVQLFSLWHAQLVDGRRLDIGLISSGLSGSQWYWDMKNRWPSQMPVKASIKSPEGWIKLGERSHDTPIMVGYETTPPHQLSWEMTPHGYVARYVRSGDKWNDNSKHILRHFGLSRNLTDSDSAYFFHRDINSDKSRAFQLMGFYLGMGGQLGEAFWFLNKAENLDPDYPRSYVDRAYFSYQSKKLTEAEKYYRQACDTYRRLLTQGQAYNALPDVMNGLRGDLSQNLVSLGSIFEKTGKLEMAQKKYEEAIRLAPSAQAHFNMAALLWNRNWEQVVFHLEKAIELNPNMNTARHYLRTAKNQLKLKQAP